MTPKDFELVEVIIEDTIGKYHDYVWAGVAKEIVETLEANNFKIINISPRAARTVEVIENTPPDD